MTIERRGLIFTKGGTYTGIKINFSLNLPQPAEKTSWFLLPTHLTILSGIIQIQGNVKIVDNQVYFNRVTIPNIQKISNTTNHIFKAKNFEVCFPGFNIYARKGSNIQAKLDRISPNQISPPTAYNIFRNPQLYFVCFQL